MQSYFRPKIVSQELFQCAPSVMQYSFAITRTHCPGVIGLLGSLDSSLGIISEDSLTRCATTNPPGTLAISFTINCLEFSGNYVWSVTAAGFQKEIGASECPPSEPNLYTLTASTTPSLPGNCTVTFIGGAPGAPNGCDVPA
ncbi:MAG: hypothetical protein Q8Q33_07985 [Chlamydiota bacterium]|nr:hypothetical protein [Chlamydiota bacterium]